MRAASFGMGRGVRSVIFVLAVLACAPAIALAQNTPGGQAKDVTWWAGGGGGYVAGRAACSNCETDPPYGDGGAVILQGGVLVRERLRIGGEYYTTNRKLPSGTFRNTQLLGIFQYRPFSRLGFFLKGGYGMAIIKGVIPIESGETTARTWGMAVMYGAGWEFKVARRVSFAPLAATYISTAGDVNVASGTASNVVVNGWFAGAVLMVR